VASENEKTVFGLPGLPLESTEAPPEDKAAAAGERTMVGLSFGADELAQLDAAIASVEERATGANEQAAKPTTQRSAPLPPPRPRGSTAAAPVLPPPAAPVEPTANGTMLMTLADFGDLDKLLSGEAAAAPAPAAAAQPESEVAAPAEPAPGPSAAESSLPAESSATMLFDADELGDALSSVFGQATSSLSAAGVEAELDASSEPDEVDAAFAATGGISADARSAALAALEEEQQASARADVMMSNVVAAPVAAPAPVAPPATAAGTLLMSSEWLEQAAAAAAAAVKPIEPKAAPPRPAPAPAPPASNETLFMGPESVVPDSSSTRTAYSAADLSDAKTELPAPEKTKRYQTGAVPRVESRPAQRESQLREAPLAAPARTESREPAPARRDTAALWVAGIATVLVLAAIAWYLLR
jgi:hypothetical protein